MAETVLNQQESNQQELNQQGSKIDPTGDGQRQNSNLKRTLGIILSLVMIGLTIYVLNLQNQNSTILSRSADLALNASDHASVNYRTYVEKYKETKIELDETTKKLVLVNKQLDQVTADLATTKGMLVQTQGMLTTAQDENTKLKQELQGLDTMRTTENVQNISELQSKIEALKAKDSQVSLQLSDLKSQLRAFQADFSSPAEGRSLIVLFQNKISLVKHHLRYLKQEAFFARVAAQKEKDHIAILNGNDGFVLHNGKAQNPNGAKKSAIDVKIVQ